MKFDIQKSYEKNLSEFQALVKEHNELDSQIKDGQEQLRVLADRRQQVYTAAKACEKVIIELQPFVTVANPDANSDTPSVDDASGKEEIKQQGEDDTLRPKRMKK